MDVQKLIQEYLDTTKAMQIATVRDGQPWLCTVYFAADEKFNLYWSSLKSRRHSQEIASHAQVAATIVKDTEHKQALQIVGEAFEVSGEELERVDAIYSAKLGHKPERLAEIRSGGVGSRAYYKLAPSAISLWDEINFPDAPKQEYTL
jgi:uncharacterized protein YhbP (UPF0306 family)